MTWNEYLEYLMERGCSFENAQDVIGHQMDIYEDWDWEHKIPFKVEEVYQ